MEGNYYSTTVTFLISIKSKPVILLGVSINNYDFTLSPLSFFFGGGGGVAHSIWKLPGQRSNLYHSNDPSRCSDNTGSITCYTTRELPTLSLL